MSGITAITDNLGSVTIISIIPRANLLCNYIRIYFPSKDKDGKPIHNRERKIRRLAQWLTKINGGSTVYPKCRGYWKDKDDKIKDEDVDVIESWTSELDRQKIIKICRWVRRFKKREKQESVALTINGVYYLV